MADDTAGHPCVGEENAGFWRFATLPEDGVAVIQIAARDSISGVSETDGLDAVSTPLGADYPEGVLGLTDDQNELLQNNCKYMSVCQRKGNAGLKVGSWLQKYPPRAQACRRYNPL